MKVEIDESTGARNKVIIDQKGDYHPQLLLINDKNEVEAIYPLPVGAHITVKDKQEVGAGDILAKTHRVVTKTKDITGGLPRVAELFEARKPKDPSIISEIDGIVEFDSELIVLVQTPGHVNQYLGKLGIDPPVSSFVCVGDGTA